MKKIFLFKVIGLYGIIVSLTGFIVEILSLINNIRLSRRSISIESILELIQEIFTVSGIYLIFHIFIIIGLFIMFFIAKSRESYVSSSEEKVHSLENQVVGILLLFRAIMHVASLLRIIGHYFESKNQEYYYPEVLVDVYATQIFINMIPILIYSAIGLLLLTYSYRKRVVYSLTKNE